MAKKVNKVVLGNETLLDLTGDTVDADKVLAGYIGHNAKGELFVGSASGGYPEWDGSYDIPVVFTLRLTKDPTYAPAEGITFQYQNGMTWGNFLESTYNVDGAFTADTSGAIRYNNKYILNNAASAYIHTYDYISEQVYKVAYSYFELNVGYGTYSYYFYAGWTWNDFINSGYNINYSGGQNFTIDSQNRIVYYGTVVKPEQHPDGKITDGGYYTAK